VDKAKEIFSCTAPKYREIKSLILKYYLFPQDGQTTGKVYLWHSRADAEQQCTDEWRRSILEKYNAEPTVQYFQNPVIVDNLNGEILKDD
jgi:hypothetical protein